MLMLACYHSFNHFPCSNSAIGYNCRYYQINVFFFNWLSAPPPISLSDDQILIPHKEKISWWKFIGLLQNWPQYRSDQINGILNILLYWSNEKWAIFVSGQQVKQRWKHWCPVLSRSCRIWADLIFVTILVILVTNMRSVTKVTSVTNMSSEFGSQQAFAAECWWQKFHLLPRKFHCPGCQRRASRSALSFLRKRGQRNFSSPEKENQIDIQELDRDEWIHHKHAIYISVHCNEADCMNSTECYKRKETAKKTEIVCFGLGPLPPLPPLTKWVTSGYLSSDYQQKHVNALAGLVNSPYLGDINAKGNAPFVQTISHFCQFLFYSRPSLRWISLTWNLWKSRWQIPLSSKCPLFPQTSSKDRFATVAICSFVECLLLFQNLTLFGSTVRLPVEKLRNPAGALLSPKSQFPNPGFEFEVVTFEKTGCVGVGSWTAEATWYPGYLWKACICPQCRFSIQSEIIHCNCTVVIINLSMDI